VKILQLSKEFSATGGTGLYVSSVSRALAAAGHHVTVIHSDSSPIDRSPGIDQFHVDEFDAYTGEAAATAVARRVMEIVDRARPDVVHVHGNNNFVLQAALQRKHPTLKTLHVYDFCPSGARYHDVGGRTCRHVPGALCVPRMAYKRCVTTKRPSTILWLYRRAMDAGRVHGEAAGIIVASAFVRDQALASGYAPDRLHVVPLFVDLPSDPPAPLPTAPRLLFVGRVTREKGVTRLLHAARRLTGPWTLTIAGDGADLRRVKRLAARLGIADRVEFPGWVGGDRLHALYRNAQVVVVPSIWPEPFGLVGLEAMSHARPVVAFAVGGIPEWLSDGETGFLVPPRDVRSMAARIQQLLDDPTQAARMGLAGRARVERDFVASVHVARVLRIYKQVAAGAHAAAS
jgi:glycosyltransferase involved in cell wall biosynthesis